MPKLKSIHQFFLLRYSLFNDHAISMTVNGLACDSRTRILLDMRFVQAKS